MSATFNRDLSPEEQQRVSDVLQSIPAAADPKTMLFNRMKTTIDGAEMSQLARELQTKVSVELNKAGDEKTLADGKTYRLTAHSWLEVRKPPRQAIAGLQRARAEARQQRNGA